MRSYEHEVYIANMKQCYKKLKVLIEKVNMIISILNLLKKSCG